MGVIDPMGVIEGTAGNSPRTIIQLSTPRAVSAIHILRLSGPRAKPFLLAHTKLAHMEPRRVYFSPFYDRRRVIDQVVLFFFQAPASYTGQDMAEIHCHGSLLIVEDILRMAVREELQLAEPGEFTKIAFLNGKLSLEQSEAIDVLIKAKSEHRKQNALGLLEKKAHFRFSEVKLEILNMLSEFESAIEFPEEGEIVTSSLRDHFKRYSQRLETMVSYFSNLVENYHRGMKVEEGIKIVIAGRPNAGKSTLMNALLREDRVLVSDLQGTTRDYVKEEINMGGFPLLLYDTAGLRATQEQIEAAGVKKAREILSQCDLQLFLLSHLNCVAALKSQLDDSRPFLLYLNKIDVLSPSEIALIKKALERGGLDFKRRSEPT